MQALQRTWVVLVSGEPSTRNTLTLTVNVRLAYRADTDLADRRGRTALMLAVTYRQSEVVRMLYLDCALRSLHFGCGSGEGCRRYCCCCYTVSPKS